MFGTLKEFKQSVLHTAEKAREFKGKENLLSGFKAHLFLFPVILVFVLLLSQQKAFSSWLKFYMGMGVYDTSSFLIGIVFFTLFFFVLGFLFTLISVLFEWYLGKSLGGKAGFRELGGALFYPRTAFLAFFYLLPTLLGGYLTLFNPHSPSLFVGSLLGGMLFVFCWSIYVEIIFIQELHELSRYKAFFSVFIGIVLYKILFSLLLS